jgi:hypothetical protein
VPRIRVLVELPGLLGDIVRAALDEADDIEVLANDADHDGADVVVTVHEDGVLPVAVGQARRLHVLAIDRRGRRSLLYRLDPSQAQLGELSAAELIETIRGAVREGAPTRFNWQPTG